MQESKFYQLAKRNLKDWEWDRIENTVSSGMPDTLIHKGRIKKQLELKIVRSGKMFFTPAQISWARRMEIAAVWGNYVLALNKELPILMAYGDVIDKAYPYVDKKKYCVALKDIKNKYEGWDYIRFILKSNNGVAD